MYFVVQHTCTVQLGTTAVLLACQFGHRELLEVLIDRYHCAATDKDKASLCILHNSNTFCMSFIGPITGYLAVLIFCLQSHVMYYCTIILLYVHNYAAFPPTMCISLWSPVWCICRMGRVYCGMQLPMAICPF